MIGFVLNEQRLNRIAIVLKPATILRFHKALVKRKYQRLYANKVVKIPGRKAPDQELIDLIIAMKTKNPHMGYGRIAMQVYEAFGLSISRFAVGRILRKYNKHRFPDNNNGGPSWLSFIGQLKDSLWSIDLFRCESLLLKSHWVMIVLDQYTRRIISFAVHAGDCEGITYCRLLNTIMSGQPRPRYLSTDNDPLYLFHRWQANLRVLDIKGIKSIPGVPTSHPFVERVIGTTRREYCDHTLFFNALDLQRKLDTFKTYYNNTRIHSSLGLKTPSIMASSVEVEKKVILLGDFQWKSHCNNLYRLPVAA